jgi:hypothetical protein
MKPIPPFVVVADRGNLRAYILDNSHRTSALRLVQEVDFHEAHQRLGEMVTDKAGAFPKGGPKGGGAAGRAVASSAAERLTLVNELESQNIRHVARTITNLLNEHRPESWGMAAPEGIFNAILEEVDRPLHKNLTCRVRRDLTNVAASKLLAHLDQAGE